MPYPGTMMIFCEYAIITPASEASMAFWVPVTPPPPAAELSPKFENSTLPSERVRSDDDLLRVRHHHPGIRGFDGLLGAGDAAAARGRALAEVREQYIAERTV